MKNLISMTDFVLSDGRTATAEQEYFLICRYANFLKQPLEIWQFVPCKLVDGVWVVLEEKHDCDCGGNTEFCSGCRFVDMEYQQAKERCLFEGFESKHDDIVSNSFIDIQFYFYKNGNVQIYITDNTIEFPSVFEYSTIEDLVIYNLTLTKTAQKQLKTEEND